MRLFCLREIFRFSMWNLNTSRKWITRPESSRVLCLSSVFPVCSSLLCYCSSSVRSTVYFCSVASKPTCIMVSQAIWSRSSQRERKQLTSKKYVQDSSVLRGKRCVQCRTKKATLHFIFIHTDIWSPQNTAVLTSFFILQDFRGLLNGYCTCLTHDPLLSSSCMRRGLACSINYR